MRAHHAGFQQAGIFGLESRRESAKRRRRFCAPNRTAFKLAADNLEGDLGSAARPLNFLLFRPRGRSDRACGFRRVVARRRWSTAPGAHQLTFVSIGNGLFPQAGLPPAPMAKTQPVTVRRHANHFCPSWKTRISIRAESQKKEPR